MFNGNSYYNKNSNYTSTDLGLFNNLFNDNLFNDNFINNILDQIMSSDLINDLANEMMQDDYEIDFKDHGDYYLIKGYLPGLTARDVSIDFEKNKAILTIKKRQVYSNGINSVMTVIQTGGNLVKTFYIDEIDVTKLRASFDNNILMITIPKVNNINQIQSRDDKNIDRNIEPIIIDVDNYKVE